MFRFIVPLPEHNVYQISIEAKNLDEAFAEYAAKWWCPDYEPGVAIWDDCFLVGQVLPEFDSVKKDYKPFLKRF